MNFQITHSVVISLDAALNAQVNRLIDLMTPVDTSKLTAALATEESALQRLKAAANP